MYISQAISFFKSIFSCCLDLRFLLFITLVVGIGKSDIFGL